MTNPIDLTWLNAVKQRAAVGVQTNGTIVPSTDDNEIQSAITGFSQYLLNWSGQATLNSIATLDEWYDGNGNNKIATRSWPVLALNFVNMNGAGIPLSSGAQSWGAVIDQSKKFIVLRGGIGNFSTFPYPNTIGGSYGLGRWSRGPVFMLGTQNIELGYNAGYAPTTVSNEIDTIAANTITLQKSPWVSDGGVLYYPSLTPFAKVANSPAAGEYAVAGGVYVFNTADNGSQVMVTYNAALAPSDLEYAVRCVVAINYKRKSWQDQASRVVSAKETAATTRYRDWAWPSEYQRVFDQYEREGMYA